ncbi:MAG: VOC family protein [Sulfitobacter sp.]
MLELDHLAVGAEHLEEGAAHVAAQLQTALQPGGAHAVFHTHNQLLGLEGGLYLEAIAADPAAPVPQRPRWFDLDNFKGPPRLSNWICRCDNLEAALAVLPEGFGAPVDLARGALRWRMAVPQSGKLPFDNCAPALIEWQAGGHPGAMLAPSGLALERLTVSHPEALELQQLLAPLLVDARVVFAVGAAGLRAVIGGKVLS